MLPSPPQHLFGDLLQFINPTVRRSIAGLTAQLTLRNFEIVFKRPNTVADHGWCFVHGCTCRTESATLRVAGPPCVDWSSLGQQVGCLGPTVLAFMVWVPMMRSQQEPARWRSLLSPAMSIAIQISLMVVMARRGHDYHQSET